MRVFRTEHSGSPQEIDHRASTSGSDYQPEEPGAHRSRLRIEDQGAVMGSAQKNDPPMEPPPPNPPPVESPRPKRPPAESPDADPPPVRPPDNPPPARAMRLR